VQSTFDEQHGKHWHCIVGKAFGSFVTHDSGCFTYFYLGEVAVLLFKTL
jgi:dynein light chain LC8-type